jgi:hypothetical protein
LPRRIDDDNNDHDAPGDDDDDHSAPCGDHDHPSSGDRESLRRRVYN